uniref:Endonuclease/exonuclease/phosphatase domain-containing protein n=1 Tax=Trichogramma kaykai TaxID=54128 RepID=A0ABD2WW19_9HYME
MRILQLNLNHCRSAQDLLSQTVRELGINVAIVCDQYKNPSPHYTWIADSNRQAAIWVRGGLPVQDRPSRPLSFFTRARVSDVYIFSVYAPPRLSIAEFSALLADVVDEAQGKRPLIVAGDFNAWSTEWGSSETKPHGAILLDAFSVLDVVLLNTGSTPTFIRPQGSSIIDLSFASDSLTPRVAGWRVERGVVTNSDHRAITFNLSDHRPHRGSEGPRRRWSARTLDEGVFSERLSGARIPHAMPDRDRRTWRVPLSPPSLRPAARRCPAEEGAAAAAASPSTGGRTRSPPSVGSACELADLPKERGVGPWRILGALISPSREANCVLQSRRASADAGAPSATRSTGTYGTGRTGRLCHA